MGLPKLKIRRIRRQCVVCGKVLTISVDPDKTYKGGHYFGKLLTGKNKKAEYWECNQCYKS